MTIGLIIAAVFLYGGRIALEWLAEKYEFFEQWYTITTIALIVVTAILSIAVFRYIIEQFAAVKVAVKNMISSKSEAQQGQDQAIARKKSRERENTRAERRAQRDARRSWRQAHRDKIQRVEAYEKRWRRERGGKV